MGIEPVFYGRNRDDYVRVKCPLQDEVGKITVKGEVWLETPGLDAFLRQQAAEKRQSHGR